MKPRRRMSLLGLLLGSALGATTLAAPASYDVEVGPVAWQRDLDTALKQSGSLGKPVFAFFQEVPGCQGCKKFGTVVLTHPSLVQAIEHEFVPLLIYNNRGGDDAKLLARFQEPAWNYQVVRFLDTAGIDLIPRKDRVWTLDALSARMVEALEAAGRTVPNYLLALRDESDTTQHATAAFSQHCFWTGEFELGRIPGVIATEAGWIADQEVTRVTYHRGRLSLESLVAQAAKTDSALRVFLGDDAERQRTRKSGLMGVARLDDNYRRAPESDQKRQIRGSALLELELSPMQATKANAFAPLDMQAALSWLTPKQRERMIRTETPKRPAAVR